MHIFTDTYLRQEIRRLPEDGESSLSVLNSQSRAADRVLVASSASPVGSPATSSSVTISLLVPAAPQSHDDSFLEDLLLPGFLLTVAVLFLTVFDEVSAAAGVRVLLDSDLDSEGLEPL